MQEKPSRSHDATELRRHAEERLQEQRAGMDQARKDVDAQRLVHELQVHQIKLEVQSEELWQSRVEWNIPNLRVLFEEILPYDTVFNGYEVEHDFLNIGRKIILLNTRQIFQKNIGSHIIILAMEDITERKRADEKLQQKVAELCQRLDQIKTLRGIVREGKKS